MILPTFMVRGMGNGVQKYKEEPIVGSLILLDEVKFNWMALIYSKIITIIEFLNVPYFQFYSWKFYHMHLELQLGTILSDRVLRDSIAYTF